MIVVTFKIFFRMTWVFFAYELFLLRKAGLGKGWSALQKMRSGQSQNVAGSLAVDTVKRGSAPLISVEVGGRVQGTGGTLQGPRAVIYTQEAGGHSTV